MYLARAQTTAYRSAEKLLGGTEGWRNPICRAVIRKIGRQEINEWTMSQRVRQLFGGRNTLKGREMEKRGAGKEMTDRDKHGMKTKKKERKSQMEGSEGGMRGKSEKKMSPVSLITHTATVNAPCLFLCDVE